MTLVFLEVWKQSKYVSSMNTRGLRKDPKQRESKGALHKLKLLVPFRHRHSYLILSPHMKFSLNRASFLLALLTSSIRSLSDFVLFWHSPFSSFSRGTSSSLYLFFVLWAKFNKRNGTRHQKCPKQYMDL